MNLPKNKITMPLSRIFVLAAHSSPSLIQSLLITLILVGNLLAVTPAVKLDKSTGNNETSTPPFNFPETSTRSIATASSIIAEKFRKTAGTSSEVEDLMEANVDGKNATVDPINENQEVVQSNSTAEELTTQTSATTMSLPTKVTAISGSAGSAVTNFVNGNTTTETPVTLATSPMNVTSPTVATTSPTMTTITLVMTTLITSTPNVNSQIDPVKSDTARAVTDESGKMPSGIIALVTMITFGIIAVVAYVSLIVWRRYLEYRYGNRELLVNDLEFDTNDLRHFEL